MKNSMVRKYFAFLFLFIFGLSLSTPVLASSYAIHFTFAHELTSVTHYFDGQNIAFEATPVTYPDPDYPGAQPLNNLYFVTLMRDNGWLGKDTIGTAQLQRNTFGRAVWSNVGPGNYYIFFHKEKDRMIVADNNGAQISNY